MKWVGALATLTGLCWSDGVRASELRLTWLPGASRAIAHSTSASRDTALFGVQFFPYVSGSAGADFAVLAIHTGRWSLRYGLFALLEVMSADAWGIESTGHWRGLAGGSFAVSADALAESAFGDGGRLEATLSVRHESEHKSDTTLVPAGTPAGITGNLLMPDLAARIVIGMVELELRGQFKLFMPPLGAPPVVESDDLIRGALYDYGPGGDLIVRWRATEPFHPFWSTFGEYLQGTEVNAQLSPLAPQIASDVITVNVPDQYLVRSQLGGILPFALDPWRKTPGDLQVFTFVEIGHGEGVLKFREEVRWGLGARGVLFR